MVENHHESTGEQIVDAIAASDTNALQDAVSGLKPEELQQIYVEINQANAERQEQGLLPVTVIVHDRDHDGRINVSGTNNRSGMTIGAEGKSAFQLALEETILNDKTAGKGTVSGGIGEKARGSKR